MKNKWNYAFLFGLIGLTFWVMFSKVNVNEVYNIIVNAEWKYLVYGLVCMLAFWLIEAVILDLLLKKVYHRSRFWTALKITIVGQYYSYLTPFASGGQPAQLYEMKKDNIPMSSGTAALVGKFIIFQVTVTVYSLVVALMRIQMLFTQMEAASAFVFIGLLINVVGLTFIVLLALKPEAATGLMHKVIGLLKKVHLVKDQERAIAKTSGFMEEYEHAIKAYKNDWRFTLNMFLVTIIQLTAFFSITFFIYRALGLSGASMMHIVSLQAMLYMAVAFIPSPGTVGASEVGFALLLGSVFSANLVTVATLLWRGISYYFGLILCGLFTLWLYAFGRKHEARLLEIT